MKCAMMFTVLAIVGLSIVSGSVNRVAKRAVIIPRPQPSSAVGPFAPMGIGRDLSDSGGSSAEAPPDAPSAASPSPDTAQWTSTLNPPVVPAEYNGDVRDLPPVLKDGEEVEEKLEMYEPHDPATARSGSAAKGVSIARDILDATNNVPLGAMPAPGQSFKGMSKSDDCAGQPCGVGQPPDVNGDVGLEFIIQAVNFGIAIYNKSGTKLASFSENSLWQNANTGTPCDNQSHGDPVVIFDQFTNRWIISNFAFGFNQNGPASPFYECFAVSKTSDNPVSGGWYLYAVQTDPGGSNQPPTGAMGDYPKFGNWNDGCLYMSANNFTFPGGKFVGTLFGSFNKADMESGAPLTSSIGFISDANTSYSMIPSNISGASFSESLPAAGTPNFYVAQSRSTYSYEVRKFTPGNSPKICGGGGTMGPPILVAQTAWVGPEDIAQPNANPLGSLGDRMMQKIQYRKVGTRESLWIVHSVEVTSGTSIRSQWAQIDVTGGAVKTTPVQQQIYTPDTSLTRWVPSIAADHDGNVALGYNTGGGSKFPSIAYSGRLATDPLGQLSQSEIELVAGQGSQRNNCEGGPCRRWGDYSSMSVDPLDDCTFWYMNQYYESQSNGDAGNWQTRIASFKFPQCIGHTVTQTLTVQADNPPSGVPVTADTDENGKTGGIVPFTLTYRHFYNIAISAPPNSNGNTFLEWQRDGVSYSKDLSTTILMDGDHTMKAVYNTSNTRSLSIKSSSPDSGVRISVSPSDISGASSGNSAFVTNFNTGAQVRVSAPATAGGNVFKRWMLDGYQWDVAASTTVTVDSDHELLAVYEPSTAVNVTIQTNPTGVNFSVDGTSYNSPQTFSWAPSSTHTIAADDTKSTGTGAQLKWTNWSDGGANPHTVTATGPTTYTANFRTQYLLTVNNGDGGVVRPLTGYYDALVGVSMVATPQTQFSFDGWVGTGPDSYTGTFANISISMSQPVTETANFSLVDTTIQLSSATYSASETAGFFNVTVVRNGPPNHTDSVSYTTSDGTAKEGRDYVNAQGVVTFDLGESSKTFPILIINNSYADTSPRTVNVKLVQAAGALLGTTSTAVLSIVDDDKTPGPNPVDDPRAFVQFNFYDFLARYPDTSGWDFWTNQITSCGSDKACIDNKRTNVSGAFFLSTEFQQSGYEVERIYKVSYGDATANSTLGGAHQLKVPVIRFAEFLSGKEAIARGVIVGQTGYQDLLENNKQDFVRALIRGDRFNTAFPTTMTPAEFVDKMNQNAGNVLSPGERNDAIGLFNGIANSDDIRARRHALLAVADDPDLVAAETNRAFVLAQYFGYLRRNPDDPPDHPGDYTGYDFWLTKLNQFNGDFVAAQMVQAFLGAGEYRQRFGPN
jgi:hypothetical protein